MSLLFPHSRAFFPEIRQAFRALEEMQPALTSTLSQMQHAARGPSIDLEEESGAYHFSAELPGARKQDLNLSFGEDGQTLTLSGSIKRPSAQAEPTEASTSSSEPTSTDVPALPAKTSWLQERFSGNFMRTVKLPTPVDTSAVKASYTDGILSAIIPKRNGGQAQSISIN